LVTTALAEKANKARNALTLSDYIGPTRASGTQGIPAESNASWTRSSYNSERRRLTVSALTSSCRRRRLPFSTVLISTLLTAEDHSFVTSSISIERILRRCSWAAPHVECYHYCLGLIVIFVLNAILTHDMNVRLEALMSVICDCPAF
jgi:hypothetical protein